MLLARLFTIVRRSFINWTAKINCYLAGILLGRMVLYHCTLKIKQSLAQWSFIEIWHRKKRNLFKLIFKEIQANIHRYIDWFQITIFSFSTSTYASPSRQKSSYTSLAWMRQDSQSAKTSNWMEFVQQTSIHFDSRCNKLHPVQCLST